MSISLEQLIQFYSDLADQFATQAAPGRWEKLPRDLADLFEWFETFTGSRRDGKRIFNVYTIDFAEGLEEHISRLIGKQPHTVEPGDIASFVLLFNENKGPGPVIARCEIYINSAKKTGGAPIFSDVEKEFFIVKEAMHCLLYLNFEKKFKDASYPATSEGVTVLRLLEELAHRTPALWELSQDGHSENLQIEIAAELLAAFLLYPPESILADRRALGEAAAMIKVQMSLPSVTPLADRYKLPVRLIQNILLWDGVEDQFMNLYNAVRAGRLN